MSGIAKKKNCYILTCTRMKYIKVMFFEQLIQMVEKNANATTYEP